MPRAKSNRDRDPLIALRIPPKLDQRLRAESDTTGTSISEIVRVAIEHHLIRAAYPPAVRAKAKAETPERPASRKAGQCEHRIRPGAYCRRCARIV